MLPEYVKNMQCFDCNGYKDGCYEEPKDESNEGNIRCFYYHTLRRAMANMTPRDKSQVQINANRALNEGLEKLFNGNPGDNKRQKHRPIEPNDIRAIITA